MLDTLLSFIAPHHCCGCSELGTLLCDNCKYDIISEPFNACVACGEKVAGLSGLCESCRLPYERAWCVADRRDHLQQLINDFKFTNTRAAYRPLAALLHDSMPELPSSTIIIPIPTVNSHIRQRGYDHMTLVAKEFARQRKLPTKQLLERVTYTTQRGSTARQRTAQAKVAFRCPVELAPTAIYLLVDDVITSGATVKYAAKTLKNAGAQIVWVASVSRQPLD